MVAQLQHQHHVQAEVADQGAGTGTTMARNTESRTVLYGRKQVRDRA